MNRNRTGITLAHLFILIGVGIFAVALVVLFVGGVTMSAKLAASIVSMRADEHICGA